jgi:hypothetical protein
MKLTLITLQSYQTFWPCDYHFYFVFGKILVQILTQRLAILIEISVFLMANVKTVLPYDDVPLGCNATRLVGRHQQFGETLYVSIFRNDDGDSTLLQNIIFITVETSNLKN